MSDPIDLFRLDGRLALVVGGSSGIGREIALAYRQAGARVVVIGRNQEKLDRVTGELGGAGDGKPVCHAADMRDPAAIATAIRTIEAEHGGIDILLNCQGTTIIKPMLEVSEAEYDLILDTNLKSVFFTCQEVGRRMVERRRGAIINIASLSSYTGWANAAAYSMSKWGIVSLTQTLAAEWGESGVRVNGIAPGFFMTELNQARMPEARKQQAKARNAMHRFGELPELVGAAIYLASPAAAFVSGETIRVDGGYLSSGI